MAQVSESPPKETAPPDAVRETPTWTPPPKPSFNSPAADLNQLRNEAKRIAETAPGIEHDLGLPATPDGLAYADLAVLLSQSK